MKKYVFLFLLIFSLLFMLAFTSNVENTFPLFGKLIILDPGHGGKDPGSTYKDLYEKDYNLLFSRDLYETLSELGATVIMTRNGDYDLSNPYASQRKRSDFNNRIKLINEDNPDLYISLHMNYLNNSKYYGSQVFYSNTNKMNEKLAASLQKELNNFYNYDKKYKRLDNSKYMYNKLNPPGVLIEYGFISNYSDRANLTNQEYRKKLAKVIAKGVQNYFN